jgi:tetratricopeptide (TPR) repeat protein
MLALETPLDAYRSDLARKKTSEDLGAGDTVWLLVAHCVSRLSRAAIEDQTLIAEQCAMALRDFLSPDGAGGSLTDADRRDLAMIVDGFATITERRGADSLSVGLRGMVSKMVEAGALSVAYTTLALARTVVVCATDRERGLLAADQAMVARLLGDLESAEELYAAAEQIGDRSLDFAVLARACIGRGVVNRVRGNYPRSRIFFERALELAQTAKSPELELLSHQGLTICLAIAKDFDRALQHGWATYDLSQGDRKKETEALTNLAQLSLDSGFPRAALQAFAAVLDRADSLRLTLIALGGAAVAAAHADEPEILSRIASEVDRRILRSALPYENAQTLHALAVAFRVLGDEVRSDGYLERTRKIAKARGFFELLHATDRGELARAAARRVVARKLSEPSRSVLESLVEVDAGETAEVLALSRSR